MSQLYKIYELIDHYEIHQQEDQLCGKESSFIDFIVDHVLNEPDHLHEDSEGHNNLPFQQFSLTTILGFGDISDLSLSQSELQVCSSLIEVQKSFMDIEYASSVFHPPLV